MKLSIYLNISYIQDATSLEALNLCMTLSINPACVDSKAPTIASRSLVFIRVVFQTGVAHILRSIGCPPLSNPRGQGRVITVWPCLSILFTIFEHTYPSRKPDFSHLDLRLHHQSPLWLGADCSLIFLLFYNIKPCFSPYMS